tara:strand:- start:656 stop:958 length:303 start_codon:yes stop_codon:yes gene_type:complete
MAHTLYRNPIKPARGTKAALLANTNRLEQWEFVYATDENKLYVWNGTSLIQAGMVDLEDANNVDTSVIADGSILVWDATNSQWVTHTDTTTTELVNGGNF